MKQIQLVVFLAILFILATSCSAENEKDPSDQLPQTITIAGIQQRDTVFLHFDLKLKTIRAQRTGKLERLVEKPEFSRNSLLVQFDDYDVFVALSGEKESLKEELLNKIDQFSPALRPVDKKWREFANKIGPGNLLPALPAYQYKEEAGALEEIHLADKYNALLKKESEIRNYFQMSTESGFIVESFAKSGDYVRKNQPLISYHSKKVNVTADASFKLTKKIQSQLETNFVVRLPGDSLRIIKRTPQQIRYVLNLKQKINPKMIPGYFIINQTEHVFIIPEKYVGKEQKVKVVTAKGIKRMTASSRNGEYVVFSPERALTVERP
ncbi:hypothetical protein [Fluviicola sp.]|uniref:hypothetical protein n=1 Tax=Fluviicola sp. TaxID=1917219 RepID=UPI0031E25D0C